MFKEHLVVLKLSNNRIATLDQIKQLAPLDKLVHLDISDNEVCNLENYKDKVYEILPNLQILDGHDRDGNSFLSEDDEMYGEEGEFEDDEGLLETIKNLDPETRKKFEAGELSMEDLKGLGILGDAEEYGDSDDLNDNEYGSEEEGETEQKGDENGSAHKKQKKDDETE